MSLGIKLTKFHRILKFKQSNWLKKYNDFKTDKRKNAANSFEKGFFKLMNNSVFGKTMENLRKRISVKLIKFSKNFVAMHEIKPILILNKPMYVGFGILDLSKYFMDAFHYKYIKNKFDTKLLFTDTDSLVYEIKTEGFYEDLYQDKDLFDFGDYPLDSKFLDPANKLKYEHNGKIISEFFGLKSNMYSLISVDDEEVTKQKE